MSKITSFQASFSSSTQVSWVRQRDWHILTSGLLTYTQEGRFTMHHNEGSTKWTLAIKYLKLEDEGVYECQVSEGGVPESLIRGRRRCKVRNRGT